MRSGGGLVATAAVLWAAAVVGGPLGHVAVAAQPTVDPATRIVLFTPSNSDPLVARIEAELTAVGIAVRRLPMPHEDQLELVITREIAAGASAAIRVIPRSRGTEVWTGETTARMLRRRSIHADTSDAALSVIALRTMEFLRASLLDVKRRGGPAAATVTRTSGDAVTPVREGTIPDRPTAAERAATTANSPVPAATPSAPLPSATERPRPAPAPAPPGDTPASSGDTGSARSPSPPPARERAPDAPTEAERPSQPARDDHRSNDMGAIPEPPPSERTAHSRYEVTAGPAVLGSPGGIAPVVGAAALVRAWIAPRVGAEAMALFPVSASRLMHAEGSIDTKVALFGGAITFRLTPPGRWTADAGVGLCGQFLRTVGTGTGMIRGSANQGQSQSLWRLAAHARVGGGVEINRWLMLRADVVGGIAPSSRIAVVYAVEDASGMREVTERASWGPTFAAGTVGLQADW